LPPFLLAFPFRIKLPFYFLSKYKCDRLEFKLLHDLIGQMIQLSFPLWVIDWILNYIGLYNIYVATRLECGWLVYDLCVLF